MEYQGGFMNIPARLLGVYGIASVTELQFKNKMIEVIGSKAY